MRAKAIIRLFEGPVAVFVVIAAVLFWYADPLYLKAPTDRNMVAVFNEHRAAFDRLRKMMIEDSLFYLSESDIDARISEKRQQEYKNLISEIRAGLIVGADRGAMRFIFAGGGLSAIGPGWTKGIGYTPGRIEQKGTVVKDLDHPRTFATGNVYLRQIAPHWFLFFQKTD